MESSIIWTPPVSSRSVEYVEPDLRQWLPKGLPDTWSLVQYAADGGCWDHVGGQRVITSVARELDGRLWMHASTSRRSRLPDYDDMKRLHSLFIGDRVAYQIFARPTQHVNIHSYCLHLWAPLEGEPPLPDFTRGGKSI